jgi:glycosyltransferase involved in cell wall biosynthesis
LEGRVSFEIGITEERKLELLRTSRALISPAPVEGFGISILEGNAAGLPVVGTDGVPAEALQEGVNGFRIRFGDIDAMADRTRRLLEDDELFDRIAQSAYSFAHGRTWSKATQPLLALMDRPGH